MKDLFTSEQKDYFRKKLLQLREETLAISAQKLDALRKDPTQVDSDDEIFARETAWITDCSLLQHEENLLRQIDEALDRLEDGTYGYCEETGNPIGIKRLKAYPVATLSIEAQENRERHNLMQRSEPPRL